MSKSLQKPERSGDMQRLSKPFYETQDLSLFLGDCRAVLADLPSESVDVVFADPPYFLSSGGITCHSGRMVSVDKGDWDKPGIPEENHEFNRQWLLACRRVMRPDATIWVSGTFHVIFSVGYAMQQIGFRILNDIIWVKPNPPPNLGCRCFTHSTETIIWASRSIKSKHAFNYQEMRQEAKGRQMRNIWDFTAPSDEEKRFGKHPTQKPLRVLMRILRASSKEGDLVLDPFNGSGTTGVAALRLGRKYIGVELDQQYMDLSIKRLKAEHGLFTG